MAFDDIINSYDKLKNRWERKDGLVLSSIIFLLIYFPLVILLKANNEILQIFIYIIIPLLLIFTLYITWLFTTNRFFLKFNDKTTVGLILINDNKNETLIVSKIIKKVINHIKDTIQSSNITIKNLPLNFCDTQTKIKNYHESFDNMYDIIIKIHVDGGKWDSIEKINIEKFSISYKSKNSGTKKKVFFNTMDLFQDINLAYGSKNWEYTLNNSGIDKKKYFDNIHHILLYYIGFYLIYVDKYEDSLNILSQVYNPKNVIVPISKKEGNKIEFKLNPINLIGGRLSTILIDLFFDCAIKNYMNSDIDKGLNYFKKLESLIKSHPQKFQQYICMARFNYELGYIEESQRYTELARKINSQSIEVNMNLGFYSIINDSVNEFCKNYTHIFNKRYTNTQNWIEVLSFILTQKELINNRDKYFDFSISFIEYVFLDSITKSEFNKVVSSFKELKEYRCIYHLGTKVLREKRKTNNSNVIPSNRKRR